MSAQNLYYKLNSENIIASVRKFYDLHKNGFLVLLYQSVVTYIDAS